MVLVSACQERSGDEEGKGYSEIDDGGKQTHGAALGVPWAGKRARKRPSVDRKGQSGRMSGRYFSVGARQRWVCRSPRAKRASCQEREHYADANNRAALSSFAAAR